MKGRRECENWTCRRQPVKDNDPARGMHDISQTTAILASAHFQRSVVWHGIIYTIAGVTSPTRVGETTWRCSHGKLPTSRFEVVRARTSCPRPNHTRERPDLVKRHCFFLPPPSQASFKSAAYDTRTFNSLSNMVAPTECVISAGRAVRLRWSETEDGSIQVLIHRTMDSSGGIERVGASEDSPWSYSERSQSGSSTIAFQISTQEVDFSGVVAEHVKDVEGLRDKIARKSKKRMLPNIKQWSHDPGSFFGVSGFQSVVQFSYQSLANSKQDLDQYQNPFHKINLACFYEEYLESAKSCDPNFLERNCMRSLMESLHHGYKEQDRKTRNTIGKTIRRHIEEGNILRSFSKDNAGLLLGVSPFLTGDE